jgi:hypothetical protein
LIISSLAAAHYAFFDDAFAFIIFAFRFHYADAMPPFSMAIIVGWPLSLLPRHY